MLKKFLIANFITLFYCAPIIASNHHFGLGSGLRYSLPRYEGTKIYGDVETKNSTGFYFGLHYLYEINNSWSFRSGLELTQREFELNGQIDSLNLKYVFAEIPLLAQYQISRRWAIFTGLKLSITATDKCDSTASFTCENTGDDAPLVLGGNFSISENSSIDIFYEHGLVYLFQSETFLNGTSVGKYELRYSGFGINYVYYFN